MNVKAAALWVVAFSCACGGSGTGTNPDTTNPDPVAVFDPVLFVHGIHGDSSNFDTMVARLVADGWPPELLFAYTIHYNVPEEFACNADTASIIALWVDSILELTGRKRLDIVAHSMGTLSTRYYIKNLDGAQWVNTYVTLGGQHQGISSPCDSNSLGSTQPCAWRELCESNEFIAQLNAPPATPGDIWWVSIAGTADTATPPASAYLEGAENIVLDGVEHSGPDGLLETQSTYEEVRRVLHY